MTFETKSNKQLVDLATAGAGFKINTAMMTMAQIMPIATAAAIGNARVVFTGAETRQQADLIKIAKAGKGNVFFKS